MVGSTFCEGGNVESGEEGRDLLYFPGDRDYQLIR